MNLIKILLALSLVVLFLLFIAQNAGYVEVSFFYTAYKVPLFVLLLFSFTFGFFIPSFYFIFKEVGLKRRLNSIDQGLKELSRGYINKAERILGGPAKSLQGIKSILAKLFIEQGRVEEAKALDPILAGQALLKEEKLQEAEEEFKRALSQDEENIKAIKGLRDVYSLQDRWQEALEYQDKVLDLCERWEKEKQKRIKAEILAALYQKEKEEKFIEKAMDLYTTPFVYAVYIKHLLSKDKTKDARKHWDKVLSLNYQEDVLWNLLEDQATLTKLLDTVESKKDMISPDVLAMVYIRLNLLSKAKELEEGLSDPIKALLYSTLSHKDQDKYCLASIKELLKPFVCSCGKAYNIYHPLCSGCLTWGEIKIRRVFHAGGR